MFSCGSFCNMHDNFENNLSAESKPTALLHAKICFQSDSYKSLGIPDLPVFLSFVMWG